MKDILKSRWKFMFQIWSHREELLQVVEELEQLKADNQVGREGLRLAELEIAHLKTKLAHAEATSEKKHNYVRKLWGFIAASRRIDIPAANGTIRAALERAQRTIVFILCLLPMLGFSQALQRQFFTTNTAPNVVVTAGTNAFITFSLVGQQRTYRVDTPASGTATNIVWPVAGTNVYLTTNGLAIVIDVPSPLIPWQAITNITSIQIPAAAITNAPWSVAGQTNLELTVAGTNVFVSSVTNLGVTTFTIDVPTQPQQTNWSWQSITNIATVQIPYSAITNPPAAGGQTNLALVVAGTNAFVTSATNLGVTTFTVDGPAIRTQWSVATITNAGTAAYSNSTAFVLSPTNSQYSNAIIVATSPTTSQWTQDASILTNVNNLSQSLSNYIVNLVANVNRDFYFSAVTNALGVGVSTNCSTMIDVPVAAAATNSIAVPTAGVYFLSRVSTNVVTRIEDGPIQLQTYIYVTGGGGVQTVTAHPELWIWFANNTMVQIATSGPQVFTEGTGEPIIFNTSMNVATATNLTGGAHLLLRWYADAVANSPTWNFVIGGVYDSHISVNVANQSGTYVGDFIGDGSGLTNIPQSAITGATPAITNNDTRNISFSGSNYQSGTVTFSGYAALSNSVLVTKGICFGTNIPTLNVDFSAGNYTFIATNNAFPISGFINYTNGLVCWQVLSYSNSAATAQTFSWPAGVLLYGTNSGTSISVASTKVLKAMISVDPHGTNLCAVQSN